MIIEEPILKVGLVEHVATLHGKFIGAYRMPGGHTLEGEFRIANDSGSITIVDARGKSISFQAEARCSGQPDSRCLLENVTIGREFHWERQEDQIFGGTMLFRAGSGGTFMVINEIPLEEYLLSVISSEMSATAPPEFLRAHAIISRSWLGAMLVREKSGLKNISTLGTEDAGEIIRWYSREDHREYDVCADDHCQRYHGVGRIASENVADAVNRSRGIFLMAGDAICDARFSKACGGRTEAFENVWEPTPVAYLRSVDDSQHERPPVSREADALQWILSTPDSYCNTNDEGILKTILPAFDQETKDFYRWDVQYSRKEFEKILGEKSGIDFGTVMDIVPLERGPSGRIFRLRIDGTKRSVVVGKELEIRKWLSPTHLRSSAFAVDIQRDAARVPTVLTLHGAGWGHGVGLCQIGAAVMAVRGAGAEEILQHYYRGSTLRKLYS